MRSRGKLCLLALTVTLSLSADTFIFANNSIFTVEQAKAIAKQKIPSGSTHIKSEDDYNKYELKFYNDTKKEMYEVDINKATQSITEFKTQLIEDSGSPTVKLTEDDIKKIIISEIPEATNIYIRLDTDDNLKKYEIRFNTNEYTCEMEIKPDTGAILERKFKTISNTNNQISDIIKIDKVKEIALNKVPNSIITDIDFEKSNNKYIYEIEMYKDNYEYELVIDAQTGKEIYFNSKRDSWSDDKYKLEWNYEEYRDFNNQNNEASSNTSTITLEKAKQIALNKVPGATIKKIKLDNEDGRLIYEGEMYKDNYEYEFEIDAKTGDIIKWEQERD